MTELQKRIQKCHLGRQCVNFRHGYKRLLPFPVPLDVDWFSLGCLTEKELSDGLNHLKKDKHPRETESTQKER